MLGTILGEIRCWDHGAATRRMSVLVSQAMDGAVACVYAAPLIECGNEMEKVQIMKSYLYAAAFAFMFLGLTAPAAAKGCIKGAVVGGAAGHYAGHHGVIGAVAGCIVGRHQAHKRARNYDHLADH